MQQASLKRLQTSTRRNHFQKYDQMVIKCRGDHIGEKNENFQDRPT